MIKKSGDKHLHLHMKSYHKEKDGQDFAKKHGYKVKNYVKTPSGTRMDIHKEETELDEMNMKFALINMKNQIQGFTSNERDAKEMARRTKSTMHPIKKRISDKTLEKMNALARSPKELRDLGIIEEVEVDEALTLQQRMKRSRLMKRMKSRIAIGRKRAMKKMANKKTIEKRAMRQARNQLAKKLTRGIPKKELTFARKQEIEKRLAKPALQQRIKRIAKRIFKDVRKKEVERKKG